MGRGRTGVSGFAFGVARHPLIHSVALTVVSAAIRAGGKLNPEWARAVTYNFRVRRLAAGAQATARRQGVVLNLDLDGNLERCLYLSGTYEDAFLRLLRSEVRPGDTYVDVGGHIGLDAFVVAKAIGYGRVVCFEPAPDSALELREGAARNRLGFVEVVEAGLGAETGRLVLRADAIASRDTAMRSRYNEGDVIVDAPLIRFDDWATETGLDRMDVVKLDIEGCEYDALVGMSESLRKFHPRCVIVELGARRLGQAGTTVQMIDDLLAEAGYGRSGETMLENVVYRPHGVPHFALR